MVPPLVLGAIWLLKRTPPEELSWLLKALLREAEVLLEVDERTWTLLAGGPDRASTVANFTCIHVMELVGDEGLSTPITVVVAPTFVLVTAESLVLLALGAGPAELRKKSRQLEIAKS